MIRARRWRRKAPRLVGRPEATCLRKQNPAEEFLGGIDTFVCDDIKAEMPQLILEWCFQLSPCWNSTWY